MKKIVALLLFMLNTVVFSTMVNLPIKTIEVINNQNVPAKVVLSAMKLKEGSKFSAEAVVDDYQKIKDLGYFEDVVIQPEAFGGGIKLLVNVFEKSDSSELLQKKGIESLAISKTVDKSLTVSKITVSGNKKFTRKEIADLIGLKEGDYFSELRVDEAQRKLMATGYFSKVKPNVIKNTKNAVITFTIVENPIIKNIVIKGNHVISTQEIQSLINSKVGNVQNFKMMATDRDKIQDAYNSKGYTMVHISDISLDADGTLTVEIVEGIIRKIEVKKMIRKQKGNRRRPTDDVLKTQTYVIDREIEMVPGQVFNNNQYEATVQNLMRLGIFKNIKYEARTIPGDPEGINLILLIDEDRTAVLQGAVSYGSEVGFMGSLSLKDSNWKGKGQEFGFTFEKSNRDYTGFTIDFFDPWIKDTNRVSWGWNAYKTSYGDGTSNLFNNIETLGFRANIGKALSKNVRLSIGGKIEKVEEEHKDGFYKYHPRVGWYYGKKIPIKGVDDKYIVWSIYPYISYDTRNNYFDATRGEYAKLQLEVGHAGGYKADYFGNVTLELRKYHRGFFKRNTFAYRLMGGIMTDTTKESQTFWVGGGNTLRGYDGGFFKGKQKLIATIENRTQINDVLGIVFFADAGRAWKQNGRDPEYTRDNKDFGRNIATTAGVGLRLNTPMGPLRFDFGWPVGNKMDKEGMKFYFNMGQAF